MRNILRTVAGVVIFLTGYFYIFGKSNEGCAAEAKSPPIRQELVHEYARNKYPSQGPHMRRLMPVTKSLPIAIFQKT
jgi:hypothetical protein